MPPVFFASRSLFLRQDRSQLPFKVAVYDPTFVFAPFCQRLLPLGKERLNLLLLLFT